MDNAGSRGGERERERVTDCYKSSYDQDASDDDGHIYIDRYRYIDIVPLSLSYRVSAHVSVLSVVSRQCA